MRMSNTIDSGNKKDEVIDLSWVPELCENCNQLFLLESKWRLGGKEGLCSTECELSFRVAQQAILQNDSFLIGHTPPSSLPTSKKTCKYKLYSPRKYSPENCQSDSRKSVFCEQKTRKDVERRGRRPFTGKDISNHA